MKKMYRAALMIAAFVFLLPLSARSEIRAGSFELCPFAGYNFFENRQNLDNAPVFGGRLGYNFTKYFGVEVAGEFIRTNVDDTGKMNNTEGEFGYPMDRVDIAFYHLDAVLHLIPDGIFNPFIVAGFGGDHNRPSISNNGDMAAFNVGLGAKLWLADNIALRLDVQDYIVTEIVQSTYHNLGITLGLTVAFGGKAKPAPVPVAKPEPKPETRPIPPPPPPKPRAAKKVILFVSEPLVEEEVIAVVEEAKPEEAVVILAFEDIHFDWDQSTLKPEAQRILKRNIQLLKENPNAQIRVAGYTSASGTDDYNQKLSERRATAVQEYLVNEGIITRDRLSTIGYGEANPAMYEAAPKELFSKAAKANMRVLFEIIVE